jgi:hypothetical protein
MCIGSFFAGVGVTLALVLIAKFKGYIALGKGDRADKVDDDLKAARDAVWKGEERRK